MNLRKQTTIAFALKVVTTLAAFGYNWLLSRLLGAEGLGAFQLAFAISTISVVLASLGLNNTVLRLIPANWATENYASVKGFYQRAILFISLAACIVTAAIHLFSTFAFSHFFAEKAHLIPLIILMSWSIIPTTLNNLFSQLLKSFGYFQISVLSQSGFTPLLGILGLVFCWFKLDTIIAEQAILVYILAVWLTLVLSVYFFTRNKPPILRGVSPVNKDKELLISSMPLWMVEIAQIIMESLDVLLIGIWIGIKEAGIYAIAKKIASLTNFFLASTNTVIAPQIATLYAQNKKQELRIMAQKATKSLFWTGLLACSFISIFSIPLLEMFGREFKEGWLVLVILSIGQFINVSTGPVAHLLIMTGNQTFYRNNMIVASLITVILFFLLIPNFSILGAAIASALGLVFENCRAAWLVQKKLGFPTFKYGK
jgi:O-antigen/teichoic acid export membrane protein